ncbi:two component transcriptional regulator, LytTR family [Flavobacteriaceae bacterium MAR_2010_188]|nr:two component transcriptional regulator, LytTR family [Flavobacteriaceae bacterium MAR_2010_188]
MNRSVNCIIVDDESLAREIIESHLSKIEGIKVVAQCKNALEAFSIIQKSKIDLVFLDINMPEISGISFAESINSDIKIIFTTAYRDYAVEGFELRAVDYLLKPISFERLLKAINAYFNIHKSIDINDKNETKESDLLFVRADRKMVRIDFSDILYIESLSDYIKIHTKEKSIVTRENISTIEEKLPSKDFIRIHRSFIVSTSKITSFTNEFISIEGQDLTISRTYKKQVLKFLEDFN